MCTDRHGLPRQDDLYGLPPDLPVPVDDGACDHLPGQPVPPIALASTSSRWIRLDTVSAKRPTVVFCYPRTGKSDREPPPGWNAIPGARGCTPQCIGFRDHYQWFRDRAIEVFGLSTQSSNYQHEMVCRLALPFEVLSDENLELVRRLGLPTFQVGSMTLVRRLILALRHGMIVKVFYPVFPPDRSAEVVASWIAEGGMDDADGGPR